MVYYYTEDQGAPILRNRAGMFNYTSSKRLSEAVVYTKRNSR